MNLSRSILIAGILAAPLALEPTSPSLAGPLDGAAIRHEKAENAVPSVQLAGGHVRFGFGPGVLLGVPYYDYGPAYYDYDDDYGDDYEGPVYIDDPVARCQARYRSFDPESGTFLGYDGFRHPCPYLG
jgi:hypothetical protein